MNPSFTHPVWQAKSIWKRVKTWQISFAAFAEGLHIKVSVHKIGEHVVSQSKGMKCGGCALSFSPYRLSDLSIAQLSRKSGQDAALKEEKEAFRNKAQPGQSGVNPKRDRERWMERAWKWKAKKRQM